MWHTNKDVVYTYATSATSTAYAYISGLGWRRIRPGAADGVTNLFIQMNAARANNRKVHVFVDAGNFITQAYLL